VAYDLMLLGDPGAAREAVVQALSETAEIRRDPGLDTRFWLSTPHGEAQVNIGTKDPIESIHFEFELGSVPLMEAVAEVTLAFAEQLDMRVEDVQWGHEVTRQNLPDLKRHWLEQEIPQTSAASTSRHPWWRRLF